MEKSNDVRSRPPIGGVGQKPVDTPWLAAGSRAFEGIVFILVKLFHHALGIINSALSIPLQQCVPVLNDPHLLELSVALHRG